MRTCETCGGETGEYCHDCLEKEAAELEAKVVTLRQRLRDQTHQTQITAQQMTDRVHEVLVRKGVVPEGVNLNGHPVEQNVGTIVSTLLCEVERLQKYETAIKQAHNGYNAQMRTVLANTKEPASPAAAIGELIDEAERLGRAEGKFPYEAIEELAPPDVPRRQFVVWLLEAWEEKCERDMATAAGRTT